MHWAVANFAWPSSSAEEMFRYHKVVNEYEVPPLEVLHQRLITLRLGRHFKGEVRLTKRGTELSQLLVRLFAEVIPLFVLRIDHASYASFDNRPFGKWDVWVNIINIEAGHGTTEAALFEAFYGEPKDWHTVGWRGIAAFSSRVLQSLKWAGLLIEIHNEKRDNTGCHIAKTPLWRSVLKLHTDNMLRPVTIC